MNADLRRYFAFFAATFLGSCLTAIASMLQVDAVFHSIGLVAVALSLKTLFLMLVGLGAPRMILSLGLRRSLWLAQLSGVAFLGLLWAGFASGSFPLTLLGIFLSSAPSVLLNVVNASLFRLLSSRQEGFRSLQGSQQTLAGLCFIAASVAVPLLMNRLGFGAVVLIDAATYAIGAWFLRSKISGWIETVETQEGPAAAAAPEASAPLWRGPGAAEFALLSAAAYLLIGMGPLISSSTRSLWAEGLSAAPHGLLWTVEALAAFLSGLIYRSYAKNARLQAALALPVPLGLLLIPLVRARTPFWIGLWLGSLSLSMALRYMKTRDDFLLRFSTKAASVRASASVGIWANFIMFLSPLLLTPLVRQGSSGLPLVVVSVGAQGALAAMAAIMRRRVLQAENAEKIIKRDAARAY